MKQKYHIENSVVLFLSIFILDQETITSHGEISWDFVPEISIRSTCPGDFPTA